MTLDYVEPTGPVIRVGVLEVREGDDAREFAAAYVGEDWRCIEVIEQGFDSVEVMFER